MAAMSIHPPPNLHPAARRPRPRLPAWAFASATAHASTLASKTAVLLTALVLIQPAHAQRLGGDTASALPASAAPYSAAVAARFADPGVRYRTPGLAPGRSGFTSNSELAQALQALAASPPAADKPADIPIERSAAAVTETVGVQPRLLQLGLSQLGQPLWALHFSAAKATTWGPDPAAPPRPTVFMLAQQHGDEPAGAEALLVLAQQLAGGEFNAVLQQLDVVLLPRANPDATLAQVRGSASGIDINRDHLLLQTPEARAIAALVLRLQPLVVVDVHEYRAVGRWRTSFGAEARHDLLLQVATTALADPAWQTLSQQVLAQPVLQALAEQGLRGEAYHENFSTPGNVGNGGAGATGGAEPPRRRLRMGSVQPDVARNVLGLRHSASLLLESRGIGMGHTHIQRRVHSQVVALQAVLYSSAQHVQALQALRTRTQAQAVAQACQSPAQLMTILAAHRDGSRELLFLDPATGNDVALQVPWEDALQRVDVTRRTRPCGYWLAADAGEAVQRLQRLGLQLQQLTQPTRLQFESWLERPRGDGAETDAPVITNRLRRADVHLQAHTVQAPAGSWWLPLSQPLAALAVAALEPDTPSSYFAHRVLPLLGSAARVMAPP